MSGKELVGWIVFFGGALVGCAVALQSQGDPFLGAILSMLFVAMAIYAFAQVMIARSKRGRRPTGHSSANCTTEEGDGAGTGGARAADALVGRAEQRYSALVRRRHDMDSVPRLRRPANADIGKPGDGLDGPEPRGADATSDAPAAGVNDKSEDTPRPAPRNGWPSLARPRLLRWVAAIVLLVAFFASDAALWVLNPELVTYVRQQVGSQLGLAASEPAAEVEPTEVSTPAPVGVPAPDAPQIADLDPAGAPPQDAELSLVAGSVRVDADPAPPIDASGSDAVSDRPPYAPQIADLNPVAAPPQDAELPLATASGRADADPDILIEVSASDPVGGRPPYAPQIPDLGHAVAPQQDAERPLATASGRADADPDMPIEVSGPGPVGSRPPYAPQIPDLDPAGAPQQDTEIPLAAGSGRADADPGVPVDVSAPGPAGYQAPGAPKSSAPDPVAAPQPDAELPLATVADRTDAGTGAPEATRVVTRDQDPLPDQSSQASNAPKKSTRTGEPDSVLDRFLGRWERRSLPSGPERAKRLERYFQHREDRR